MEKDIDQDWVVDPKYHKAWIQSELENLNLGWWEGQS